MVRIDLKPIAPQDALRLAQLATAQSPLPPHVLEVVAKRSGGNPQFLRDLLRSAIESGGIADLPESAEAATMTRIDTLAPEDRALVRRVAVFGLTFHPRMLSWLYSEEDGPAPDAAALSRAARTVRRGARRVPALSPHAAARLGLRGAAVQAPATTPRRGRGAHRRGNGFPGGGRGHAVAALLRSRRVPPGVAVRDGGRQARGRRLRLRRSRRALRARAGGRAPSSRTWTVGSSRTRRRRSATRGTRPASTARRPTPTPPRAGWSRSDPLRGRRPAAQALARRGEARPVRGGAALGRAGPRRARERGRTPKPPGRQRGPAPGTPTLLQAKAARPRRSNGPSARRPRPRTWTIPEALGDAYLVMGWAYSELGKEGGEALMQRSLEALSSAPAIASAQADILSNLGAVVLLGGPLGRGDVLLRAGPRRGREGRRHGRRGRSRASTLPRS